MDVFVQCRVTSDPNVPSLQSNEKGDVLNPLITGVFLEVCVTPHMHKHTHTQRSVPQMGAFWNHIKLCVFFFPRRRPTARPTSRMLSSCCCPYWRSSTSRGGTNPRSSDRLRRCHDAGTPWVQRTGPSSRGRCRALLYLVFGSGERIDLTLGKKSFCQTVLTFVAV